MELERSSQSHPVNSVDLILTGSCHEVAELPTTLSGPPLVVNELSIRDPSCSPVTKTPFQLMGRVP